MTTQNRDNPHVIPGLPVILHPELDAKLESAVQLAGLPEHMHEGIIAYLRYGRPCGDFLRSVISNDAAAAIQRADPLNVAAFGAWFQFLHWAPFGAWGSPDAYQEWLEAGRQARAAARRAAGEDAP